MFFGASSTAIDLVAVIAQPFEALYQVNPGRGRRPAVEAVFKMTPPPCRSMIGTTAFMLTAVIRSKVASSTASMSPLRWV